MQRRKILITGSEGRIGRQLVNGLSDTEYEIKGLDIVNGQDVADYNQLRLAAKGAYAIIHTAFNLALERSTTGYDGDPRNFAMGRFVLNAAAGADVKHCIMASSVHAARSGTDRNWAYRQTKVDLERLATQFATEFPGTAFTSIRYGAVNERDAPPQGPLRADQSWISARDNVALVSSILESTPNGQHTMVYGVSNRIAPPYDTTNRFGWAPQDWFGDPLAIIE